MGRCAHAGASLSQRLRAESGSRPTNKIRLLLNGAPVGEPYESDRFRSLRGGGEMWCGIFAEADRGTRVKIQGDNVRLISWNK